MSVFKGAHWANKHGRGGKGPLSVEVAAGKAAPGRGGRNCNPSGAQQGSSVSHTPQTDCDSKATVQPALFCQNSDSSEQMTSLAVKQGEWLLCSAQESIFS